MAYRSTRNRTWSRRPSRSYGARGGRTHSVTRPKRWEVATLYIHGQHSIPTAPGGMTMVYVHLASVQLALANATGDPAQQVGTALSSMQRACLIGGLVYDWGGYRISQYDSSSSPRAISEVMFTHQLLTDRLIMDTVTDDVRPASLGSYEPFAPTFPMASLSGTAPVVDQASFPTRVHFAKHFNSGLGSNNIIDPVENTLYVPDGQMLTQYFGTVNRRLKLRLDDEQGLFAMFACAPPGASTDVSGEQWRFWLRGKLYYRYLQ